MVKQGASRLFAAFSLRPKRKVYEHAGVGYGEGKAPHNYAGEANDLLQQSLFAAPLPGKER